MDLQIASGQGVTMDLRVMLSATLLAKLINAVKTMVGQVKQGLGIQESNHKEFI